MPRKTGRAPFAVVAPRFSFNEAAARCRGKPALAADARAQAWRPSMRPRPDAAENRPPSVAAARPPRSFNEAAARCRGKPDADAFEGLAQVGLQ